MAWLRRLPTVMLFPHAKESVRADVGCAPRHLLIPSWVAGKANIQLDSSGSSMLRLDKRRALGYPAGA